MAILTERDRTAVKTELAKLAGPVKLVVFTTQLEASEYCVETERLADLYRNAACLVQPSRYEGFGLPVLEAMA